MKVGRDFFIYRLAYKSLQVHQFSIYKLFPWGQNIFFFFFFIIFGGFSSVWKLFLALSCSSN